MGNTRLTRRQFLGTIGAGAGVAVVSGCAAKPPKVKFEHGIASGDPLQDRVILWTRVTSIHPDTAAGAEIAYEVAEDPGFARVVAEGVAFAAPDADFTVKVDATGLKPGQRYFYRFRHGEVYSPDGRTRTLPEGAVGAARIAVVSCASFPHGFFNVYRELAGRLDLDLIVHLGDYLYEYDVASYLSEEAVAKGRGVQPEAEITELAHYRARHAFYKQDSDLQDVHRAHPFITIWDDHEVANDSFNGGAENHDDGEGDWAARKAMAIQAYMEWMPIRQNPMAPQSIYRSFEIGNLASLIMLDTRHDDRAKQISYSADFISRSVWFDFSDEDNPVAVSDARSDELPAEHVKRVPSPFDMRERPPKQMTDYAAIKALDPDNLPEGHAYLPDGPRIRDEKINAEGRQVMGAEQEAWFKAQLQASKASGRKWQIIGQQIILGERMLPDIADRIDDTRPGKLTDFQMGAVNALQVDNMPLSLDEWGGYGEARNRMLTTLAEDAANAVVLAGDSHNSWAFDLKHPVTGEPAGVEYDVCSITSPGMEAIFPVAPIDLVIAMKEKSPNMKFVELERRGYLLLEVTAETVTATWELVDTVLARSYTMNMAKTMRVTAGERVLEDLS